MKNLFQFISLIDYFMCSHAHASLLSMPDKDYYIVILFQGNIINRFCIGKKILFSHSCYIVVLMEFHSHFNGDMFNTCEPDFIRVGGTPYKSSGIQHLLREHLQSRNGNI